MKAGTLDRRITLQAFTSSRDPITNELIEDWDDVVTVWAKVSSASGREFAAGNVPIAERRAVFTIRFRAVSQIDRVSYDGEIWEIVDIREIGRREGLELHTVATDVGGPGG